MELEIAEALSRSNQRVEDDALLAKIEIARHAERAMDELAVKVGWMIRSNAQLRRFRNARKAK